MKLFIFIYFLGLSNYVVATPKVDLDVAWKCLVTSSNDSGILPGTTTREFSLRSVSESGIIRMTEGLSISLYSKLQIYSVGSKIGADSGFLALATQPTDQKELHGTIYVSAKDEEKIDLEVSVFQTTRVYDQSNGWPVFIFKKSPKEYNLACERAANQ